MNKTPPAMEEALKQYIAALAEAQRQADTVGEGKALLDVGTVYATRNQVAEAFGYFEKSLAVSRSHNDKSTEAQALANIAILYNRGASIASGEKALEYIRQAILVVPDAAKTRIEFNILTVLGNQLEKQDQVARAIECYSQAIALAQSIHDERTEADATWYLARSWGKSSLTDQKSRTEAIKYFTKAAGLYHKIHDVYDEAWTDQNIGDLIRLDGRPDQARSYYLKAISYYRKLPKPKDTAIALSQLANLDSLAGKYIDALKCDLEALDLYQKIGDKSSQAVQLIHIAQLYWTVGKEETAIQYDLKALSLLENLDDVFTRINALMEVQIYYWRKNDRARAQTYLDRLIPLLQEKASGLQQIRQMHLLAGIYLQTGEYAKATALWQQLLTLQPKIGLSNVGTIGFLGETEFASGHPAQAMEYFKRELAMMDGSENNLSKASLICGIAAIEEELGDLNNAELHLRQAVALEEKVRESLDGLSDAKSTFLTSKLLTYQEFLALLLHRNKTEEAFALAQKMKGRALLDILNDGKVHLSSSLTPEEREQEQALRQKSDGLNYRLVKEGVQNEIGSRKRAEAIKQQLAETERDLQVFEDRIYASHPDVAAKRAAKTITVDDVAGFLPEDTALLEYIALKVGKVDEIALFVVTQTGGKPVLSTHILPIPAKALTQQVDALKEACTDPHKPYRTAAQVLYQTLIAPAEASLAGKKRLLICPDGVLWDVPFAALLSQNSPNSGAADQKAAFLIQRFEIAYAYSGTGAEAESKVRGNKSRPTKTMLTFADPDFGGELRFGDHHPGERPILSASRPILSASRHDPKPTRPILSASRHVPGGKRPILSASRHAPKATRPILSASRPILSASRPILSASRDPLQLLRGGFLSQLPGTLSEARAIKADFKNAAIFTGSAAQESTAKRAAGQYRYLHFATHGFFNDAAPLLSAIVLAQPDPNSGDDGFLTAREIFDLDLHADMVVLSACNTARGEKRSGEGLIGLTWALFAAGAPTQVVSQWSVNDESTAELMKRFYFNLTQKHLQKGAALRHAILSLKTEAGTGGSKTHAQNGKWSHPYYWAPFILMGDWR